MKKIIYGIVFLMSTLSSCNSTKVISSWKAENYTAPLYKHIIVWGILTEKDSTLRHNMEHHLVGDLKSYGYDAVSSMDIYGSQAFEKIEESAVVNKFKNSGVDAVMTIVLLSKTKELDYQPGNVSYKPVMEYEYLEKYYSTRYIKVYTPGYYSSDTKYYWESNLYDLKAGKLAYSVQTNSFNPSSTATLAHENGLLILKDMTKKKLLTDQVPHD